MTNDPTKTGLNRTGMDMAPIEGKRMMDVTQAVQHNPDLDVEPLAAQRAAYIASAGLVGSVPMPGTLKGAAMTALQKLKGERPEILIDKLGERLAFERTGARLYELLIAKCNALPDQSAGISLDMLGQIHRDELRHFDMLVDTFKALGADPTAQTPDADVIGVASSGILQVLSDPRTTVTQCLSVMLTAELTDNEGWETLIKLTESLGLDELSTEFQKALSEERQHLRELRAYHSQMLMGTAPEVH